MEIVKRLREKVTSLFKCFCCYASIYFFCGSLPLALFVYYFYQFLEIISDISILDQTTFFQIFLATIIGTILLFSLTGWMATVFGNSKTDAHLFVILQAIEISFEIGLMTWFLLHKFDFEHKKVEKWLIESMSNSDNLWYDYQIRHHCCGVGNYNDWLKGGDMNIPQSCCKPDFPDCARNRSEQSICCAPVFPHCSSEDIDEQVFEVGCQSSVEKGLQDYKHALIYAGIIVVIIQLLLILSVFYCAHRKQEKKNEDEEVKETPTEDFRAFIAVGLCFCIMLPMLLLFILSIFLSFVILYCNKSDHDKTEEEKENVFFKSFFILIFMLFVFVISCLMCGLYILWSANELRFIFYLTATIFSFVVYTAALDFYGCFVRGKSFVKVRLLISQHTVAFALQIALLALYLNRGTYFEDHVEGWLRVSMDNYRKDNGSAWESFQREFECCGINNYTDWCSFAGRIPSSCCKPESPNCDLLSNGTDHIFDAGCKTAALSQIEDRLTGLLCLGEGLVLLKFLCFILEMAHKRWFASDSSQNKNVKNKPQNKNVKNKPILKSRNIREEIYSETNPECRKTVETLAL